MDQELVDTAAFAPPGGLCVCTHQWQHFSAWIDVMAVFLKVWRHIRNRTTSVDTYLLDEQSSQISSISDFKQQSLRLFSMRSPVASTPTPTRTRTHSKMSSDLRSVPDKKKSTAYRTSMPNRPHCWSIWRNDGVYSNTPSSNLTRASHTASIA